MNKKGQKEWQQFYNQARKFAEKYGTLKLDDAETKQHAKLLQEKAQVARDCLEREKLTRKNKAQLIEVITLLSWATKEAGEALERYGIALSVAELAYVPDVPAETGVQLNGNPLTLDELCATLWGLKNKEWERYQRNVKRFDDLADELATLCPGVGAKKGAPDRNQ